MRSPNNNNVYVNTTTCTGNLRIQVPILLCLLCVVGSSIIFQISVVVGARQVPIIQQRQRQRQQKTTTLTNHYNYIHNNNRYMSTFVIQTKHQQLRQQQQQQQQQQERCSSKCDKRTNSITNYCYKHKMVLVSSLQQRYQTQITTTANNNNNNNKVSSNHHLLNRLLLLKECNKLQRNKFTLYSTSSSNDLSELSQSIKTTMNNSNNNSNNRIVSTKINDNTNYSSNTKNKAISTLQQKKERQIQQLVTLVRVVVPSIICGILAAILFPSFSMFLVSTLINNSQSTLTVLSQDTSQFVQNFLSVASLLFSILVGQTYYFLYTQQESLYYALFEEVTEAKSLLEQVALVCQGRSMYIKCLIAIQNYVSNDLKQIQKDPAILLSSRPIDDPLESIMYMTSVGVPSTIYMTIKSLRETRARRLGALQRKLPRIHILLLYILACIELISFPLLGAGTQIIGGSKLLSIEGILFGIITFGIVLTLRVVSELWRPAGGSYNVDTVLSIMISGLEDELQARMNGQTIFRSSSSGDGGSQNLSPSSATSDKTKQAK